MRRFTSTEIGALVLAGLFFFIGLANVILPQPGIVPHYTNGSGGGAAKVELEVVSKSGARVYGIVAMCFGVGIASMALYRQKK